jgi:membrane fusion protein (multidrug efflux system)
MLDKENTEISTPTAANSTVQTPNRRRTLLYLTLFIVLAVLIWFLVWVLYLKNYEETDDAYVNGNLISISSVISGTPIAFFADNTDLVEEGQVLIVLDSTSYQLQYERELSSLAATVLQVKQIYDRVEAAQLDVQAKRVQYEKATFDLGNREKLISSQAISKEEYVHAKDTLATVTLDLQQAEQQFKIALAAAGPTTRDKHPLIEVQKLNVRTAFYNINHCTIVAPTTGYIAQRAVEIGKWITPNTPLMAIVPITGMWIDANFKETQLRNMRMGQPASITFDLYGKSRGFKGNVIGIGFGTGSVFSIIPPQNATGNWIKIVQRLPVRIGLNPQENQDFPLRLGLSASVSVDITNVDLPMIASIPSISPVGSTSVFDLNFKYLDQLINQMIIHYLQETRNEP